MDFTTFGFAVEMNAIAINIHIHLCIPFLPSTPHHTPSRPRGGLDLRGAPILPRQDPHEDELHDVAVDEEELGAAVALRPGDGVHAAAGGGGVGGVGEEDVFEGTELRGFVSIKIPRTE